jgi:hypothetical protein
VGIRFSKPPHPLEIGRIGQAELALHLDFLVATGSTVPVHLFNMIVLRDGQPEATLQSAALQDFASTGRFHAGTKAMHAHPAPDFWLVSSFGHSYFPVLQSDIRLQTKDNYTLSEKKGGVISSWYTRRK